VTKAAAPTTDGDAVSAYEALRTHVLTGSTLSRPAGLVVLLRQGMAAWWARRGACSPAAWPAPRTATPQVADEMQVALVQILVSMALAPHQAVRI
jgi:hypothetical protein|tara:strand:- start:241 stop:525 length:285 start_codon:yes stop_codon:yes gene_type:complete